MSIFNNSQSNQFICEEPNYYYYFNKLEKLHQTNTIVPGSGLIGGGDNNQFKLTDFSIKAEINDTSSTTVFTQRYLNEYKSPVEAKYSIPLPPYASISGFVVTYEDKVLIGVVKEKEEAFSEYSDAIASGNQAFLGEKSDDGYFNLSIGNLPPTKEVTISITITSEIGTHLSDLHYCLHRFMFPQYQLNLSMDLNVQLSSPIESIEFYKYPKQMVKINGNFAIVSMQFTGIVNDNIVVIVKPTSEGKPNYFLEGLSNPGDNQMALALSFYPRFKISQDEIDQKSEYIFLLDCSGSMEGIRIQKSRLALEYLIRSLTIKTKFNIFCFGSSFKSLFPTSQFYDDATVASATQFISEINADMGGTEILSPIQNILTQDFDPEYPRQLFILTDGEVSSRDKVMDYVGKEANTTRIFTLGIGDRVDKDLVIGLSKACKGFFAFIDDNGDTETQVMKLLNIAMEPTISNIKVDWNGLNVTQAPQIIRPIFNNERMMIYAMLNSRPMEHVKVISITCDGPKGEQLVYKIDIDFSIVKTDSTSLRTLTALQIIKELEELERKKNENHKDRIVELGKKYKLESNHTSFIVISESDQPVLNTMKSVNVLRTTIKEEVKQNHTPLNYGFDCWVPNEVPRHLFSGKRGEGTFDDYVRRKRSDQNISIRKAKRDTPYSRNSQTQSINSPENDIKEVTVPGMISPSEPKRTRRQRGARISEIKMRISKSILSPPVNNIKEEIDTKAEKDSLIDIIRKQNVNGSFTFELIQSMKLGLLSQVPRELSPLSQDVYTTLFIIAYIMKKYSSRQSQWSLVVSKATKFVKFQLITSNISSDFDTILKTINL